MLWWLFGGPGWMFGLVVGLLWIAVIVGAVVLLHRELPHLQFAPRSSPALRLLEERYARGEISREEFLERRAVLLRASATPASPSAPPSTGPSSGNTPTGPASRRPSEAGEAGPTEPLPPVEPQG